MCWYYLKTLKYIENALKKRFLLRTYFNRHLSPLSEWHSSNFNLTLSEYRSPVDVHTLSTEVGGAMRKLPSVLGLVKNSPYATNLIPYSTCDCQDFQVCWYWSVVQPVETARRGCPDLMDYCMRPTGTETSVLMRCFNPRVGRDLAVSTTPHQRTRPLPKSAHTWLLLAGLDQVGRPGMALLASAAKGSTQSITLIKRSHQYFSLTEPSCNMRENNDS